MATGIVSGGVTFAGFHGLGSASVRGGTQVPSQYYARNVHRVPSSGQPYDYMRRLTVRGQVPQPGYSQAMPRTCGEEFGLPCMDGNAVASTGGSRLSGLGGLGDVSNFLCSDWATVMNEMQVLLSQAEAKGMSSVSYQNAKDYFESTTGVFQKPVLSCASATATAKQLYNALAAELGVASTLPNALNPNSPNASADTIASAVKWGAIALACVAGAYALGPLFRGIGGLIPKGK